MSAAGASTGTWTCARCPAVLAGVRRELCIECELAAADVEPAAAR